MAELILPYTGYRVPAGMAEVTVKIAGEMPTHEGVAFTATLSRGKVVLGALENHGTGGGTWFLHRTVEDMRWWQDMVTEHQAILAREGDEDYTFMAAEELADRLYENAAMFRDLNRKRSVVVRFNGDNDDIRLYKGTWDAQLAAHFANVRNHARIERWIKNEGWTAV